MKIGDSYIIQNEEWFVVGILGKLVALRRGNKTMFMTDEALRAISGQEGSNPCGF